MSITYSIIMALLILAAVATAVQHRIRQEGRRRLMQERASLQTQPKPKLPNWESPTAVKFLYQLNPAREWDGRTTRYVAEFGGGTSPVDLDRMNAWAVTEYIYTHYPPGQYRLYLTEAGQEIDFKELMIPERTVKA